MRETKTKKETALMTTDGVNGDEKERKKEKCDLSKCQERPKSENYKLVECPHREILRFNAPHGRLAARQFLLCHMELFELFKL